MSKEKIKVIRDPVHNYIEIPQYFFSDFIDTAQFQRLRNIEQTHLQQVYPSATNSRFEHSLGVYHLGKNILESISLKQESGSDIKSLIEKYRKTVEIACLLHDIGHAPLSHIGEHFFSKRALGDFATETLGEKPSRTPASHEVMSCLVALKVFKEKIEKYNVETELFCRLIMGQQYGEKGGDVADKEFRNALINILSGPFDADKMDYIMRDSQSAGVQMVLDVPRIIKSFNIIHWKDGYRYVVEKTGFSVASHIITNRDYLYYWVYGHHKVQYHSQVIKRFLVQLKKSYKNEFEKLFSCDAIIGNISTGIPFASKIQYVDDHDITRIAKYIGGEEAEFNTFFEQIYEHKHYWPIWKTKIEFDRLFSEKDKLDDLKVLADDSHAIGNKIIEKSGGTLSSGDFMAFGRDISFSHREDIFTKAIFYLSGYDELFSYPDLFPSYKSYPASQVQGKGGMRVEDDFMLYVFVKEKNDGLSKKITGIIRDLAHS